MNVIEKLDRRGLREDLPALRAGDTVRVHVKVKEGDKERVQVFEGTIIALKHGGPRATITVRKTSFGHGVERIFPVHAKSVEKIEVVRSHHVRRAKLYFMRGRKGKAARLKEKRPTRTT
ncbi:MAG: 50S ribosomal protein L19 [Acidobacteriota bacterium]